MEEITIKLKKYKKAFIFLPDYLLVMPNNLEPVEFRQFLEIFLTVRIGEGVLLASRMLLNIPQCAGERTPTTN